jgi:hypothetical protein
LLLLDVVVKSELFLYLPARLTLLLVARLVLFKGSSNEPLTVKVHATDEVLYVVFLSVLVGNVLCLSFSLFQGGFLMPQKWAMVLMFVVLALLLVWEYGLPVLFALASALHPR